jgi:hypothetical protein
MVQVKRCFLHCPLFNVPPATWVLCATLWHSNNFNPLSCGWVGYLFMDSLPPPNPTPPPPGGRTPPRDEPATRGGGGGW